MQEKLVEDQSLESVESTDSKGKKKRRGSVSAAKKEVRSSESRRMG